MLSFWVSLLLLMVALAMVIQTANSQLPMKLEVSVKKSNTSGYNTIDQETIRLARARPGERAGGDERILARGCGQVSGVIAEFLVVFSSINP